MHATATVNGTVIADTDNYEYVEGNVYFPTSSIKDASQILVPSTHTTHCPWKGDSAYYNLVVNGETLQNAAWYYPEPLPDAKHIKDHVAFYKAKVNVDKDDGGHGKSHGVMDKMKHMFNKS